MMAYAGRSEEVMTGRSVVEEAMTGRGVVEEVMTGRGVVEEVMIKCGAGAAACNRQLYGVIISAWQNTKVRRNYGKESVAGW